MATYLSADAVNALVEFGSQEEAASAVAGLHGKFFWQGQVGAMKVCLSSQHAVVIKPNSDHHWDALSGKPPSTTSAAFGSEHVASKNGVLVDTKAMDSLQTTFIVHGLDTNVVTLDHIFNLFGYFGNVAKCKSIPQKSVFLVEYVTSEEARNAYFYVKGMSLFGRKMDVSYSILGRISMVPETFNDYERDYTKKKMYRYPLGLNSSRAKHMVAPTEYIHLIVTNWKPLVEKEMRTLFGPFGKIVAFTQDRKPGMAFIVFETSFSAIDACACLHDYVFQDGSKLVVSFTTKDKLPRDLL